MNRDVLAQGLGLRLHARAQLAADRVLRFCTEQGEQTWSYAQVDAGARKVAAHLLALNAKGERALLLLPPGFDFVIALFGCFYAGVVAVPAYPPQRGGRKGGRLDAMVADCTPRFVLAQAAAHQRMTAEAQEDPRTHTLHWLYIDELPEASCALPHVADRELAVLQYTSGSTSTPKGVMLTHAQLAANVRGIQLGGDFTEHDHFLSWLPPFHDMGLIGGILSPLLVGMESTLLAPSTFMQHPLGWLERIQRYRATISGGPNFAYELCARRLTPELAERLDLSHWRLAFCGAERVRTESVERFLRATAPARFSPRAFLPCYGLAESTLAVTFGPHERAVLTMSPAELPQAEHATRTSLVGCGRVIDGCSLAIVDPQTMQRLDDGQVGEIWVRGSSVASGYWNDPARTQAVFEARIEGEQEPWLRTGDLGLLRDGELFPLGRLKDLLILRGRNYYPEDVEGALRGLHPALRTEAVIAFSCEQDAEERLVLVHEIDPKRAHESLSVSAAIRAAVAEQLQLPVHDVVLIGPGTLPRTTSGKPQRGRARELYLAGAFERVGEVAPSPRASAEADPARVDRIAAEMAKVLGLDELPPDADFFWLGGHSLLATMLIARLREALGVELELQHLFENPSARALAARCAELPVRVQSPAIEPVALGSELPLTFSQERMWVLHQLDPQGSAYNVAGAVMIEGPLDVELMRRAFDDVSERHEALRMRVVHEDGTPYAVVDPPTHFELPLVDCRGPDAEARAIEVASRLANKPFDVAREGLARGMLCAIEPERHLLTVSIHHLVTDAWSMGLLLRDLSTSYRARSRGQAPRWHEQPISYAQFAAWQRSQTHHRERDLSYWKQRLAGCEPLILPTSRPRPEALGSHGAIVPFKLTPELLRGVSELAASESATPFMVLLAAFDVLLHRHSGQRDIVVGVPVAGRGHLATEELVGTMVNTLALRSGVDPAQPFRALIREVRASAIEAYQHQDLPFEQLVTELAPERRAGSTPLVQVMFDYAKVPMPFDVSGLTLTPVEFGRGGAQFELSLLISESELGRTGAFEYNTQLFDAVEIERLAEHYVALLQSALAAPELPIGELPMLSESERAQILARAGVTTQARPGFALLERLATHSLERPDAVAVGDARGTLSYRELHERVQLLAQTLRARGVGPGQRVAVCMERSRDLLASLLAVLAAGAAYVPIDPRHPAERIGYVLADATPSLVLSDGLSHEALVQAGELPILDCTRELARPYSRETTPAVPPSHAAYVIYTSGSTGRPKGVEISRAALDNFLHSMLHEPGLGAQDRVLAMTTVAFDIAGLELYLPIMAGAMVYIADLEASADGERLRALVEGVAPTLMQATPASWRLLLESGFEGSGQLTILCGGEALPPELAQQLLDRCARLWNVYGPTETTIWSLVHEVRAEDPTIVIGHSIGETRSYVLDRHGALCPLGVAGELYIGGRGVATGYWQREELTREKFVPDPFSDVPDARMYRTGDLARLRFDGHFECLGRLDFQIKIRGFRIEPGEIETCLLRQPGVRQALVIARQDRRDDTRLVAYYVSEGEDSPLSLRDALATSLPEYMVPSAFVRLDEFPRNTNGKIDRKALPAPESSHLAALSEAVPPRTPLEHTLARVWCEALNLTQVGIKDSFFSLGGHSLLAVRMFARIARELDVNLPLATLFEAPTIEQLALRIGALKGEVAAAPPPQRTFRYLIKLTEGARSEAPLFCVHGAGGTALGLSALARSLPVRRPFYALETRGVDGVQPPFSSIQEAASAYLEEVRQLQPQGPYHLSGYCGGGVIAYEMARELRAAGEQVALLALIDTPRPGFTIAIDRAAQLARNYRTHGAAFVAGRVLARLRSNVKAELDTQRIRLATLRGQPVSHELRDVWLTNAFFRAVSSYRLQPYDGRLVLLRATGGETAALDRDSDLGWSSVQLGALEIIDVPGGHETLLNEPYVSEVADALRAQLERRDSAAQPLPRRKARGA